MSRLSLQNVVKLAAPAVPAVVGVQAVADGLVGGALHGDVERRVHAQAALVHGFGAVGAFQIFADFLDEIRRQRVARRLHVQPQRLRDGLPRLRFRDFAVARHEVQHEVAPRQRALRVQDRRIARAADQARQQRGFGQRQLAHRFAEIIFRGGFKSVIAVGEINLVAVHRENLLLGIVALDLNGQQRFLNLAAHAAVGAVQKQRAGKLHGQRAGALGDAMRQQISPGGAGHAREIHAPVLVEMLVFGGEDGVLQDRRNLFVGKQDAALQRETADHLAVVGVQLGDDVGAEIFERADLRKVARIDEQQACQRADGDRRQQQQRKSDAPDNLAAAQAQRDRRQLYHENFILAQMRGEHAEIRKKLRGLAFLD